MGIESLFSAYPVFLTIICTIESLVLYNSYRDRKKRSDELEAATKSLDEKQAALVRQEEEERQRIADWKRTVLSKISEEEVSSRARTKEERKNSTPIKGHFSN